MLFLSLAAGTGGYVAYGRHLREIAQNDVREEIAPYGAAISLSVAKRLSLLAGLKAFVELDPDILQDPERAAFNEFARRMRAAATGIKAVEFVGEGVRRAQETGRVTLSGPVELLQGGLGLIARQAVIGRDSEPFGQVAVVLDVRAILREAGLADGVTGLEIDIRDGSNAVFFGAPLAEGAVPVREKVDLPDGRWQIEAVPVGGWRHVTAGALNLYMAVAGIVATLTALLAFLVINRQRHLKAVVEERTRELREAYRGLELEIQQRTRSERALKESETRLRRVLRGSRDGFFDWNVASGEMFVSDRWARILGYEPEELDHRVSVWKGLTHPEDLPELERVLDDHFAGKTPYFELEHRLRAKSGRWKWVQVRGTVVERDEEGKPLRAAGIHTDIAAHKLLEEELVQAQKLEGIGRLAGGIAHDFNNLLTAIVGYAELAKNAVERGVTTGAGLRDDIEEIIQAGGRATSLTQELLAFARKQMINPQVVDLREVVRNTIHLLERLLGETVQLTTEFADELPNVRIDPSRFDQVLINLAINARDAMPDGGVLSLSVGQVEVTRTAEEFHGDVPPGSYVRLDVTDTGAGMDEQTMALAFEPFFSTKAKGKGTGLGLSTSYGIIKQVGGYVLVESEPGKGTTFKIYLPAVVEQVSAAEGSVEESGDLTGSENVLLVEDEPSVRRMISKALESHGYRVQVAQDGLEALELLKSGGFTCDLLITDVVMPRLGGKELVERLASLGYKPKVLFVSGYAEDAVVDQGALVPGLDFLAKPFSPKDLLRKIQSMLHPIHTAVEKGNA